MKVRWEPDLDRDHTAEICWIMAMILSTYDVHILRKTIYAANCVPHFSLMTSHSFYPARSPPSSIIHFLCNTGGVL